MKGRKILALVVAMTFVLGAFGMAQAAQHEKKAANPCAAKAPEKPAAVKAKSAKGSVKSASEGSLVVMSTGKEKKDLTFAVDAKTAIKKGGKAVTAKDLKEGDAVTVSYTEADGKMMAKSVTVSAPPKAAAAKPAETKPTETKK